MIRVSSAEFQRQIGRYKGLATTKPVVVVSRRRAPLVMISIEEHERLKAGLVPRPE